MSLGSLSWQVVRKFVIGLYVLLKYAQGFSLSKQKVRLREFYGRIPMMFPQQKQVH